MPSLTLDLPTAIDKLRAAASAWESVQGITRWWRQQDLVDKAFRARFERSRARGSASALVTTWLEVDDDSFSPVYETVLQLFVAKNPDRFRVELLSSRGHEARADLVVINGSTFWDRTGGTIRTNYGNPHSSHGGANIARLLTPTATPELFDLELAGSSEVAGRPCTILSAAAHPETDNAFDELPFQMISGGTEFRFFVDDERGCLLRATKLVDGHEAETNEFTKVSFDVELSPELFGPLV